MLARKLSANTAHPVWAMTLTESNSLNLNWTPTLVSTGGTKTWTAAFWIYLTAASTSTFPMYCGVNDPDETFISFADSSPTPLRLWNGSDTITSQTVPYGSWHHVCVSFDSTVPSLSMYLDGALCTGYSAPALNNTTCFGSTTQIQFGNPSEGGSLGQYLFAGQMADIYFVDGLALPASDFINGAGNPILYSGAFGNNGFHLTLSGTGAALGNDSSGNGNNFTNPGSIARSSSQAVLFPGKTATL